MKYKFTEKYLQTLVENAGTVKEIDPVNCNKNEFRELISYFAVNCSTEINDLKSELDLVKEENEKIKSDYNDLKTSMDKVVEDNLKLRNDVDLLMERERKRDRDVTDNSERLTVVEKFKVTHVKEATNDRDRIVKLERHSRGRNLRFCLNTKEDPKENTTELLREELVKVGLDVHIEHSHRVGRKTASFTDENGHYHEEKPRQIIACFSERPERLQVLAKRSQLFTNNCKVFEDLCYEDFMKKKKHKDFMNTLYQKGFKVRFTRGCWYVRDQLFDGIEDLSLYT